MLLPSKQALRGGGLLLGAAAFLFVGYWVGSSQPTLSVAAEPLKSAVVPVSGSAPVADNSKRVVAYIYGNVPITREEFGDYFISMYGNPDRLEMYINRRIIEIACAKRGIDVTPEEVDAAIAEDCKKINVSKEDFIGTVLKTRYRKTIDEWRIDVMKPRLLLAKLCRDQISVDQTELKQMYENRYGEKARVKIILWPKDKGDLAVKMYGQLRGAGTTLNPDAAWDEVATKQPDAALAARAGEIEPIGRFSGSESAKVEEIAFNLKEGGVSPIIELPIGYLVVKRIGTIPPAKDVDFEKVKAELRKEVVDRKIDKEVPKLFTKMKEEAKPMLLIGKSQTPTPEMK